MIYNDTKFDYAKTLIQQRDSITQALQNQSQDAQMLPRTQLYCEEVINELDSQIVDKMDYFTSYNITHANDGNESYNIPINGQIKDFPTFIDLQNSIKKDGYFNMSENFAVATLTESSKYSLTAQLSTGLSQVNARNAQNAAGETTNTEE